MSVASESPRDQRRPEHEQAIWNRVVRRPRASFDAEDGENLAMAAARDTRDYRSFDPRRVEGPIPVQCRSGACGYCWIGLLEGRENLSGMTEFERRRLEHFGYASGADAEGHPRVRLACQCACLGDLTLVVPPWNGVLSGGRS